jgi:histidine triad (HIT) family protein
VEASVVFEDDATLAFMDLRQPNGGHVLVIPKQHVETIYDLPPDVGARLMQTVVRTARAMRRGIQPDGLSIWQSNGEAAGQEVPHLHMHLFARQPRDGFLRVYPERPARPDRSVLDQLAERIGASFV